MIHTSRTWDEGLQRHLRAENEHDMAGIMSTFGDQAVFVWGGQPYRGQVEIRRLHEALGFGDQGAFSELRVIERQRHHSRNAIIIEQTFRGRHTGTWEGAAPTFKDFDVPVCRVFEFDDEGRLISERAHVDQGLLWRQIHGEAALPPRIPARTGGPTLRITM